MSVGLVPALVKGEIGCVAIVELAGMYIDESDEGRGGGGGKLRLNLRES